MSNVLIGIIGVILFIGLALAGALILGDDFRAANNESRAAAMVASNQQVSQAVAMHNIKKGTQHSSSEALTDLAPRFLKSVPINPMDSSATHAIRARDESGNQTGATSVIVMTMAVNTRNTDVCMAVARETGFIAQTVTAMPRSATIPAAQAGCFRPSATIGGLSTSHLVVFQRV